MNSDVYFIDAEKLFTEVMADVMMESGLTYDNFTKEEMHEHIKAGTSQYQACWDDFISWVNYGDNKKLKTLGLIKSILKINRIHI